MIVSGDCIAITTVICWDRHFPLRRRLVLVILLIHLFVDLYTVRVDQYPGLALVIVILVPLPRQLYRLILLIATCVISNDH